MDFGIDGAEFDLYREVTAFVKRQSVRAAAAGDDPRARAPRRRGPPRLLLAVRRDRLPPDPVPRDPFADPARFPWHEVRKVQHYYLDVDAMAPVAGDRERRNHRHPH